MTREEYILLYEKCQAGDCSPDETKLLEDYSDRFELTDGEWTAGMGDKARVQALIYNRLQKSISDKLENKPVTKWYWMAAASVVLVASVTLTLLKNKPAELIVKSTPRNTKGRIVPGSNKAILTLSNGSKINLDDSGKGTLAQQGQCTVKKLSNGQLVYTVGGKVTDAPLAYNTATTPRGGQYKVVLSDGTLVWLNAASSLKYPVVFTGKQRHVELTGEAYFEVAKNKEMPFSVSVKGTSIEVLGTHFNVSAYDDDNNLVTTLLEGSVKLKKAGTEAMLKPGQQAVIGNTSSSYQIAEVNTDAAVAWKNGYFVFDDENIENIMKRVSRWYDVDVAYKDVTKDQNFGGTVSKFSDVTDLLKVLQMTGTIHFKIEGRKITAMP